MKKLLEDEMVIELEKGKSYLLEQNGWSWYPDIFKVECLDVTQTSYAIKIEGGNIHWIDKYKIVDEICNSDKYMVKEKL